MERWARKLPRWEKCVCTEGKHSVGMEEGKTVKQESQGRPLLKQGPRIAGRGEMYVSNYRDYCHLRDTFTYQPVK